MTKALNIAAIKKRVTTAEAKLKASAQEGQERGERLVKLLDAVEKNFARSQERIISLDEKASRVDEENKRLKGLLNEMLAVAETARLEIGGLAQQIDRLDSFTSEMNQDAHGGASEDSTKEPASHPLRKRLNGSKDRARSRRTAGTKKRQ